MVNFNFRGRTSAFSSVLSKEIKRFLYRFFLLCQWISPLLLIVAFALLVYMFVDNDNGRVITGNGIYDIFMIVLMFVLSFKMFEIVLGISCNTMVNGLKPTLKSAIPYRLINSFR